MLELAAPAAENHESLVNANDDFSIVPDVVLPVPLKNLRAGQTAFVSQLLGSPHDVARLSEMGLRRGVEVTVIRNGITCILQLDGNRLCIRLSKDLVILVTPA